MLDIDGLGKAVLAHGNDSAEQILIRLLQKRSNRLRGVKDDVAAIIIKQLEPQRMAKVPRRREQSTTNRCRCAPPELCAESR